jgi:hypothetical protein
VDDNNSEEINLPQMQESRYRGNPERLLPDVWIDSLVERDVAACLQEKCGEKMRVMPRLEGMMDR